MPDDLGRAPGRRPRQIVEHEGGARTASSFDAHGWRSLAPITHSISTNVYTPERLLRLHQRPGAPGAGDHEADDGSSANPNVLEHGHDRRRRQQHARRGRLRRAAGRPTTSSTRTRRCASPATWPDPIQLQLGPLPKRRRRGRDGVLDDRRGAVQVRPEQGQGRRVHEVADLQRPRSGRTRSAARREAIRASSRPTSRSTTSGRRTRRPGWPPWVPLVLDQLEGEPRRSRTTSSGCSSS